MYVAEEVGGEFVVAGGEAAAVFQAAEHALDGVAALVEGFAEAAFPTRRCAWAGCWGRHPPGLRN